MDVLGAFVELADAQLAIADPQPADADMVRRTRAHRLRRGARLRRAALIALGTVFIMLAIGAAVLLSSVR